MKFGLISNGQLMASVSEDPEKRRPLKTRDYVDGKGLQDTILINAHGYSYFNNTTMAMFEVPKHVRIYTYTLPGLPTVRPDTTRPLNFCNGVYNKDVVVIFETGDLMPEYMLNRTANIFEQCHSDVMPFIYSCKTNTRYDLNNSYYFDGEDPDEQKEYIFLIDLIDRLQTNLYTDTYLDIHVIACNTIKSWEPDIINPRLLMESEKNDPRSLSIHMANLSLEPPARISSNREDIPRVVFNYLISKKQHYKTMNPFEFEEMIRKVSFGTMFDSDIKYLRKLI